MEIIRTQQLEKCFHVKTKNPGLKGSIESMFKPEIKSVQAVNSLNLSVNEGEILAFIGPNGAGKSTTIKMLTGILTPTSGSMEVLGLNPSKDRHALSYQIGSVFGQKSQLWFHLPPSDSFNLLGKIYELGAPRLKTRIDYLSEVFEIQDLMKTPVRKMSLGQRIRCEIAASLLHEPKIIFLDEPTIGLDVIVKQKIRQLIKDINREEKTTIFLTSHDAGDIEELCKRVVVINHGQIVTDETVKELKTNYLTHKIIGVLYNDQVTIDDSRFLIHKQKGGGYKIEIDTQKITPADAINQLMSYGNIIDITIEDPPLEEIIALIYKKKREELAQV